MLWAKVWWQLSACMISTSMVDGQLSYIIYVDDQWFSIAPSGIAPLSQMLIMITYQIQATALITSPVAIYFLAVIR